MAPPANGGGGEVQEQAAQPQQQQRGIGQMLTGVIRIAVFWYFASKFFSPKKPMSDPSVPNLQISNLFNKGEPLDMWFYLSEQQNFSDFGNEGALIWHETNIPYAVWGPESTRSLSLKYHLSEAVKNNGSLYAHVFFARSGYSPDPNDPEYQPLAAFGRTYSIVAYLPKSKADKKKSLLRNSEDSKEDVTIPEFPQAVQEAQDDLKEDGPPEWISYWKPNVTINLVDDFTRYTANAIPPIVAPYINIESTTGNYYPTVFFNEFWLLRDKLIAINDTVTEVPLHLEVSPISMTKWQLFLQMDQSFQIHRSYGSMLDGESDELKRVFLEGNPYLLGVTMIVSVMHSLFDFLAFKNDIQFWNKNKSMEGLSAKSVVVNFFCQFIVFLYLLDNDTSWMILASSGVGCCIEFWKIGKAMHIEIDRSGRIPMLRFRDRESYAGNKTKEYDDLAMKYLSYVLFFLAVCFAIYSLMYDRHKSWYSWILSSLTSCVYMFGFVMMCPQLFINYKLKSVAHLPWRQMTYKFLNTIIDDLFAFVIKMPTLHRLSVFRDDLIFLIYIYQRWVYPVDKKRVNEFGFAAEDVDQAASSSDTPALKEDEKKTN
ncbi:uncharacterized protein LOC125867112 isoform X1 [Solanum stenotomum]|uniref:uncharacterized protein LOC125867112 isoform X1 n=1 Tax=Solanum stenotomum TaxID=172797 RepID=UPI0020D12579|nr:uncharacterized protein LOC125867112 isoform X1 [Solanum stenotomum]